MKKPAVDYRGFRLSRIHEPQFCHLKLLLGWAGYFVMYFLTEALIPAERCHVIHIPLDDRIPFCELFVIPYVAWYALILFSLGYFLLYDVESFKHLQIFLIVTQISAMAVYLLYPSRQELRPAVFPRENLLSDLVGLLYTVDTNTGVFPSMHVAFSIAIASVWLKQRQTGRPFKAFILILAILICLSTAFIKQHSIADAFAALPVCLLAELITYGKGYWRPRIKKTA